MTYLRARSELEAGAAPGSRVPPSPIPSSACWVRRGAIQTLPPPPHLPGSCPEPTSSAGPRPRPVCQSPGTPGCRKCPASGPSAAQPRPPEQPDSFHPLQPAPQVGLSHCQSFSFLCTFAQGEAPFTWSALSLHLARLGEFHTPSCRPPPPPGGLPSCTPTSHSYLPVSTLSSL